MEFGAVTFVLAEAIFRETRAEVAHNRIARHLRDHTRGRDAQAVAIAIDDGRLRQRKWKHRQAVDQDMVWLNGERRQRGTHRFVSRAQNIDRIDLDGIDDANRPRDRIVRNEIVVNFIAFLRQQLLRVVQFPVPELLRKNYHGRHDWTGERATAGFIDPRDGGNTERAQFAFMPESAAAIHATAR